MPFSTLVFSTTGVLQRIRKQAVRVHSENDEKDFFYPKRQNDVIIEWFVVSGNLRYPGSIGREKRTINCKQACKNNL